MEMNLNPILAEIPLPLIGAVGVILFVVILFIAIWASRYTKVGPNEVLVISGRKRRRTDPDGTQREVGFRIVKGGGVFVFLSLFLFCCCCRFVVCCSRWSLFLFFFFGG